MLAGRWLPGSCEELGSRESSTMLVKFSDLRFLRSASSSAGQIADNRSNISGSLEVPPNPNVDSYSGPMAD